MAQEERNKAKEEEWRKKREIKRQQDMVGAEKEAQARQESLQKKVDQAIREYDDLCKPGWQRWPHQDEEGG